MRDVLLMATCKNRGRKAKYCHYKKVWIYDDNKIPIEKDNRPCVLCEKDFNSNGIDPCLGKLPGVANACCGHGRREDAYVQFNNGITVRGFFIEKGKKQN